MDDWMIVTGDGDEVSSGFVDLHQAKVAAQKAADRLGCTLWVCHRRYPGTVAVDPTEDE